MVTLNHALWALSLILLCALLAAMVGRGIVRRVPVFSVLIAFYVLRSSLLYIAFGHMSANAYTTVYSVMSLVDLGLQIAVAWEIVAAAANDVSFLRRAAMFGAVVLVAAGAAFATSLVVKASPRSPVDRGVLLTAGLMLLLWLLMATGRALTGLRGPARRLLEGFAALGAVAFVAQVGRAGAALHRNAPAYTRYAYGSAIAYLVVLLFWLITLRDERATVAKLHGRRGTSGSASPAR